MATPRGEWPSRQKEYRQLSERVLTLEDMLLYFIKRTNELRIRIKALEDRMSHTTNGKGAA